MKKLILLLLILIPIIGTSQGLLKPVPGNMFSTRLMAPVGASEVIQSKWLLRLNTGVVGTSYGKNKTTKQFEVIPLSAVGFGLSYLHYKAVEGLPFNDFGVNVLLLQNLQSAGMGLGVYGTYNTGPLGLLNVGTHYDFSVNQVFFDTGLTFHF